MNKVKTYFKQCNLDNKIHEFSLSSSTVELAAIALNCQSKRIAKTLSFQVLNNPILIVTAGDAKIDNFKFKQQFNEKAVMIPKEKLFSLIGYEAGGVCPFVLPNGVRVYLDISLKRFPTVFPACGDERSAIELTIAELEKHSNYIAWIDVCKNW